MRYLLLEKDLEERDQLDLITKYSIYSFLTSQFAENVVKELWRSQYATSDSIFAASTNFYLFFNYYHCEKDEEMNNRFMKNKQLSQIENNSMQFTVWRFSAKSRTIVDAINTIVIASLTHYWLRNVLLLSPGVIEKVTQLV